jgi:parvulin-like peptidyl-prolyl isomerase
MIPFLSGRPSRPVTRKPLSARTWAVAALPLAGLVAPVVAGMMAALLSAGLTAAGAQAQQRITLDETAIVVNNKVLTRREVAAVRELQTKEAQARFKGDELAKQLKTLGDNLVNQLVENLLIEARAEELGIAVSDKEIDQRMESIVRRDPAVMDIYTEAQLKDYIYKDILRRQVLQREVNARVRVDDEEIKRACLGETRDSREVDVGHILLRGHDSATLEKLRGIRKQLADGADFALTATAFSEDPSAAANHGRLGFVSRGQFVKEFEDKAFSLAPGQISDPVETQFGYHLIAVFGERQKAGVDCERLDEANRLRIYNRLYAESTEKRMREFLAQMKKRADIVVSLQ